VLRDHQFLQVAVATGLGLSTIRRCYSGSARTHRANRTLIAAAARKLQLPQPPPEPVEPAPQIGGAK
jgi:hypothetical protein